MYFFPPMMSNIVMIKMPKPKPVVRCTKLAPMLNRNMAITRLLIVIRSRKKVFLYHCLQLVWSKVGDTSLLNQRKIFFVLADDELAFLSINQTTNEEKKETKQPFIYRCISFRL